MRLTRRRLLHAGGALAGASAVAALVRPLSARAAAAVAGTGTGTGASASAGLNASPARRLALSNLHTSERLDLEYFRGTDYVPDSLSAIQVLLRDYRNGEQHVIDPALMDYLHDVARDLGVDPVFSVISGYRSPRTNEQLRERSAGVARYSLHLEGRAIDVRLAGVGCDDLATRARAMSRGGVGFYRHSNFVHLDTGPYRTWNG